MNDQAAQADDEIDMSQPLKVYWAPGCSACLRMKEFLTTNGVAFISVNALEDREGFEELAKIGVRRVPIAARGRHWADGQVLGDLARVAGVRLPGSVLLSPFQLIARGSRILEVATHLLSLVPEDELDVLLPGRPRSYKQLGCHIFQIVEVFLELVQHKRRVEYDDFFQPVPSFITSSHALVAYGQSISKRYDAWARSGTSPQWDAKADVYYGEQTLHEFLERSVWHAAQHTRQVEAILRKLGTPIEGGLQAGDLAGLPMPGEVYDDTIKL